MPEGYVDIASDEETVTISIRIGLGHDTHRLTAGGPLRLGGVEVPHDAHLSGHSDADVLLHAITDALLGAIAAGDIGELFPDGASENRGRDSAEMLEVAYQRVRQAGYHVVNLDCIVFAQRPKLSGFKQPIRERIAGLLAISGDCVSVKAKTGEQVGPIGRQEAISAECIVLLDSNAP
jgi:2-C-methyl-D-erythritol 2,4-cyclodiphosphate synthase